MDSYKNTYENKSGSHSPANNFRSNSNDSNNSNNDVYLRNFNKSQRSQSNSRKSQSKKSYSKDSRRRSISNNSWVTKSDKREDVKSPKERKSLDFLIFTFDKALMVLEANNESKLNDLRQQNQEVKIYFDDNIRVPEVPGKVIVFESNDLDKKCEAARNYFQLLKDYNLDEKKDIGQSALVLVPNGLVSMIIGTKGKQIITLGKSTHTQIAVNQPVLNMLHRTISINGSPNNISNALKSIYNIMEERYFEVKNAEVLSLPMDLNITKATVSILLPSSCIVYINDMRSSSFLRDVKRNYGVEMTFQSDKNHRFIDRNEGIAVSL